MHSRSKKIDPASTDIWCSWAFLWNKHLQYQSSTVHFSSFYTLSWAVCYLGSRDQTTTAECKKTNKHTQVLAHGTVDALYHAFRAVNIARQGTQSLSDQPDAEDIVELLAFAEKMVQEMLDRGFGQAAQAFNVTQTHVVKYDPVLDVPEVWHPRPLRTRLKKKLETNSLLKPQIPRAPRRSLRPRVATTPEFSNQKSTQKLKCLQKTKSPKKPKSPQMRRAVAADLPSEPYYTICGILDEDETRYLVDWGDIGLQSFSPTWEPKGNVTNLAIRVWAEARKKKEK